LAKPSPYTDVRYINVAGRQTRRLGPDCN